MWGGVILLLILFFIVTRKSEGFYILAKKGTPKKDTLKVVSTKQYPPYITVTKYSDNTYIISGDTRPYMQYGQANFVSNHLTEGAMYAWIHRNLNPDKVTCQINQVYDGKGGCITNECGPMNGVPKIVNGVPLTNITDPKTQCSCIVPSQTIQQVPTSPGFPLGLNCQ